MATKQEEIRNLAVMYRALSDVSELEEKIKREEEKIEKQKKRSVGEKFHDYEPPQYEEKKKEEIGKRLGKIQGIIFLCILIPVFLFVIIYNIVAWQRLGYESDMVIPALCVFSFYRAYKGLQAH